MFNADGTKNWSMNRMISEGEAAKNVGAIFGGTGSKNYSIIGQAPCRGKQSNYQFPNILEVDNAWTMIKFWDGVQRYSSTHRHHVYGPMSKQYIEKRAQFPCSDVRSRNPRACCVMLKGVHSLNGRQLGLPFVKNKIPAACEKSFGIYNLNSDSCKSAVAKSRELGVSTNRKKDLIELYAEAETTAHAFGQSNAKLCGAWSNHPKMKLQRTVDDWLMLKSEANAQWEYIDFLKDEYRTSKFLAENIDQSWNNLADDVMGKITLRDGGHWREDLSGDLESNILRVNGTMDHWPVVCRSDNSSTTLRGSCYKSEGNLISYINTETACMLIDTETACTQNDSTNMWVEYYESKRPDECNDDQSLYTENVARTFAVVVMTKIITRQMCTRNSPPAPSPQTYALLFQNTKQKIMLFCGRIKVITNTPVRITLR